MPHIGNMEKNYKIHIENVESENFVCRSVNSNHNFHIKLKISLIRYRMQFQTFADPQHTTQTSAATSKHQLKIHHLRVTDAAATYRLRVTSHAAVYSLHVKKQDSVSLLQE